MTRLIALLQTRAFQQYLLGLLSIFIGAWAMSETGSMVPMAMASSLGLMLGLPWVRQLVRQATRRAPARPTRR
jgi:hypothetical protein